MDPTQFDRFVAALARPASRRTTIASLLGGAVAGALGRTTAAARRQHNSETTPTPGAKKRAHPDADAQSVGDAPAANGGSCPSGKKSCHGRCLPQHRSCGKSGGCIDNGQRCKQNRQCCTNQCDNGVCAPKLGCAEIGDVCTQNSDCCAGNCFGQVCTTKATTCSGQTCNPAATGCCPNDGCCLPPANQCNGSGLCCAPNCTGRQCGPDGCGNPLGTCGMCAPGQSCSATGKCQGKPTCSPATCPHGCCDQTGVCQPGTTEQACGTGGQACVNCPGAKATCRNGQCACTPQCQGKDCGPDGCGGSCGTCPTGQTCIAQSGQCKATGPCSPTTCPNGCCDKNGLCQPGNNASFCGTGGAACVACEIGQDCNGRAGQCQDRPGCGPENCNGCCDPATFAPNSVCRPGTTTALCGTNGADCVVCRGSAATCQQGLCECTPDCQGKQCGDDNCGGSCGTCAPNQFCLERNDPTDWQCVDKCTARNCPNGCCDATGTCRPGNSNKACGTGGTSCQACTGTCQGCFSGGCAPKCDCGGQFCSGETTCDEATGFCCQPVNQFARCSSDAPCCPPAVCGNSPDGFVCCWPNGVSSQGEPMNCCSHGIDENGVCCQVIEGRCG